MAIPITLDKEGVGAVLLRLAKSKAPNAGTLFAKIMGVWGNRPDRTMATLLVDREDLELLQTLGLPERMRNLGMLQCGWLVTYRHPIKTHLEVVVHSTAKPSKRRTFKIGGAQRRLVAVKVERIQHKEAVPAMAKTRAKSKKVVEEDFEDELDALEELDDLEDEDLEDVEEPEDEDEEEDEEDEEPAPKKRSRSKAAKPAAKKKASKKVVEEDDEDDEDEDDEDEDEEPAPKKSKASKKAAKAPAKKGAAKRQPPAPRPLPAGKLGPQEIAELAGVDARAVRVFLRANQDEFPKDEESFRYAFGKRDAQRIVKAMKKG